ncbi:CHAT domain-containing protein [uncultured Erythrobacter sp.]|uniref:CHAT domain-containing protein n=1 Tax=uncultured Erythrobacter sp. TaxID=263913 RepID=UPI00260307A8|nr:CHAT domain-containing protein [uncultured Erythrobacter sp.]
MTQTIRKSLLTLGALAAVGTAAFWASPNTAQVASQNPVSLRDTFPIGSNGLCEAQIQAPERGSGLFDRKYNLLCRDAGAPIGTMWVVRGRVADEAAARFAGPGASCSEQAGADMPSGLEGAKRLICSREGSIIRTELLVGERGNRTFAASGLSAYRSALSLGVASLANDRLVPGTVDIPLTQTTDTLAFARQQAESITADQALNEAYRRANAGEFAEAAEFFAASAESLTGTSEIEARLNEGLLQSNLGNFAEARRRFEQTSGGAGTSPVLARLQRNYEAIDALNQGQPSLAIDILNAPLRTDFGDTTALRSLQIGPAMARRLAAESDNATRGVIAMSLTPIERAQLLDGQADYLRATSQRQLGDVELAASSLSRANTTLSEVRSGRIISILWLRAQVLSELAELSEGAGDAGRAEALHKQGIALLDSAYPESPALYSAQAQLAGLYARTGREGEAIGLYREIVAEAEGRPAPSLRNYMASYFSLLLADGASTEAADDIFSASQLLLRPGLAQTQAVLARELSGGSDEASALFRQSVNLGRSIERTRAQIIQIEGDAQLNPQAAAILTERQSRLVSLQDQQAEVLQKLAEYPRFRAVSGGAIDLAGMQSILRPGEAYVKMVELDSEAFMIYITPEEALAYRVDATPDELEDIVLGIRESIAIAEGAQVVTFPFDLEASRDLYLRLFGPIADRLPGRTHIVFEPDGALLKLPINLLVTDDASVAQYQARLEGPDGDDYDFRGVQWLGRNSQITTSVAPTAFRDVRAAPPSAADKAYLGLGENTPIGDGPVGSTGTRSALAGGENCLWSENIWSNPIKSDELFDAASRLGGGQSGGATVLTKDGFTDTAIKAREDLGEYRILHFATHGLVTAPQPECPPRPALLTSFGDDGSDGLLSFAEIFALRIDADLVILSACDTAGSATVGAALEAGIVSRGEFALDGLVRAFVGAGGRTVLASHWPVPDDYNATTRLIGGLFEGSDVATADALRLSQVALMDDRETSHPFYWSAFAVVGDGSTKVVR